MKILVVEDEWLIAEDFRLRLVSLGHKVIGPAQNCASALEAVFQTRPDVALVDIMLGSETCEVVLDELRAQRVPVFICTGIAPEDIPEFALPYRHLSKPYSETDIVTAVGIERSSK